RDDKLGFGAFLQEQQTLIPSRNHLAHSDIDRKWLVRSAFIEDVVCFRYLWQRGVKQGSVKKVSRIVHMHGSTGSGRFTGAFLLDDIVESVFGLRRSQAFVRYIGFDSFCFFYQKRL